MAKLPTPIEYEVMGLTHIWDRTGNPAAAWRAFHLACANGIAAPPAVMAEVARFAAAVTAPLVEKGGSITKDSVSAAWGIMRGRKPAPELRGELRDLDIYVAYWDFRRGLTSSETARSLDHGEALEALSDKFAKEFKTIEEIMTAQFEMHGPDDPYERGFGE